MGYLSRIRQSRIFSVDDMLQDDKLPDLDSSSCLTCYGQGIVTVNFWKNFLQLRNRKQIDADRLQCDLCGGTGKWRALTRR